MEEDDDDFGQIYTDNLRKESAPPAAAVQSTAASQGGLVGLNFDSDTEKTSHLNTAAPARIDAFVGKGGDSLRSKESGELSLMKDNDIKEIVEEREDKKYRVEEDNTENFANEATVNENPRAPNIEESDEGMKILLNDNNNETLGMERNPGTVVADVADAGHHHHQAENLADEQGLGGEEEGGRADVEKDLGEASKASGGGGGAAPAAAQAKIVFQFSNQSSSQFKYVRPGAATLPGAAPGGITGQILPPISMGPPAGLGRGDWRPEGMNWIMPMHRGYHPGYAIPARGVNIAGQRAPYFNLPSDKTIFDFDIDGFEEKRWRLPGVDVSDFFNFNLNEDSWRDYRVQLGQLQFKWDMQNGIHAYETGRIEQDYNPGLPPELAAAVRIQDNPSDPELATQASLDRLSIPVYIGSGDRVASIDMLRPRMHDIDTIIKIVCDSSVNGDDVSKKQDNDLPRNNHLRGTDETDDLQQDDVNKRDFDSRRPLPKKTVHNDVILREGVSHLPSGETDHSSSFRKYRYDREEVVRPKMGVQGKEHYFSYRGGDLKNISEETWNWRHDDPHGRTRLEDPRKGEHGLEVSNRNRDKPGNQKTEKDELYQSRNQLDSGSWRRTNHDNNIVGPRQRDRIDRLKSRSERVDNLCSNRRYGRHETSHSRAHAERHETSHSHIERSAQKERRDHGSDQLKRDPQGRSKDDEVQYAHKKEGGSSRRDTSEKLRERDEWHRSKRDDHLLRKNDDYKASSREYHSKDIGRHGNLLKQRDRVENDFSRGKSHEDAYVRRNQLSNVEKISRDSKPTSRNECVSYGPDTSRMHESKRKGTTLLIRETDSGDHSSLIPPKRNRDDQDGGSVSEKANLSSRTEQKSGRGHTDHEPSGKQRDDSSADDEQPDSMRGRSKSERWSSHKEADRAITPTTSYVLSKRDQDAYNSSVGTLATKAPEDPSEKIEENPQPLIDYKDTGLEINDDDDDDTAVVKKQSDRFKLPMPSEKDSTAVDKTESEPLPFVQTEPCIDSEIKSKRPPRRSRWDR